MGADDRSLFVALKPTRPTLIVDIGANPIDGTPPYRDMLHLGICTVVGFEPQKDALARLAKRKGPCEQYLPYAIGDGADHILKVTAAEGMSSFLFPDQHTLKCFTDFDKFGAIVREERIPTKRLDDVSEIQAVDFLKIDIQGGELSALKSGISKLAKTVAIQIEVPFVPLYRDQPLFGEIDLQLRQMGFLPHCFVEQKTWPIAPFRSTNSRQLLEADMLYVRDFRSCRLMSGEQWKHLALIAHYCYKSVDLAMLAIRSACELGTLGSEMPQFYSNLMNNVSKKRRR